MGLRSDQIMARVNLLQNASARAVPDSATQKGLWNAAMKKFAVAECSRHLWKVDENKVVTSNRDFSDQYREQK